ncbi:CD3072 family TudS-related putative desulfidase [Clostridium fallax]|uniref:Predicted secreted protein n=1 Tax=Clostridium fallax TaxID=1533 RepID=A0A1M4W5P1_9CLOT|nr:CD3072 family TudS-related putative desulfidase [Clostridium fallax]SHE76470.1 Predicted secreted protein [Clostridium fallax]SQB22892.1 Protein of uncharacterised function (DUF523) [Clostridium fallax]
MDTRKKNLIIISHCIINQNSVVFPLARAKGAFPFIKTLIDKGYGIIQLPCPEFKLLGLSRKPMSKEDYCFEEYRNLCKNLFIPVLNDIKEYIKHGYNIKALIGIKDSPTCSLTGNRGIFMEEILNLLKQENININTFQVSTEYTYKSDFPKELTHLL